MTTINKNSILARIEPYADDTMVSFIPAFAITKMLDRKYLPTNFPSKKKFDRIRPEQLEKYKAEAFTLDEPSLKYILKKAKDATDNIQKDLRVFLQLKSRKKLDLMTDYADIVVKNIGTELHNQKAMAKIIDRVLRKKHAVKKVKKIKIGKRK